MRLDLVVGLSSYDSSTIIYGLEVKKCNSAIILDLVFAGELKAIINEKVIEEIRNYFLGRRGRNYSFLISNIIQNNFEVISKEEIKEEINNLRGQIKEKNFEHLATVRHLNLKYLIAYDRDYEGIEEYRIPRKFLMEIGEKTFDMEY